MKQLKFMLAAATAIGLATAAQAATQIVQSEISSENFDGKDITLNDTAAVLGLGFTYEGATATDNESCVVAGGANGTANALNVNTGTDPLLRKIDTDANNVVALDTEKKVYINTMVQFTVTPNDDSVSSANGDKLMIYFKEDLSDAENPKTNLVVKALQFAPESAPGVGDGVAEEITIDTGVGYPAIKTNTWYSLVVTSTAIDLGDGTYLPVFKVKVNDTILTSGQVSLANDGSFDKFPSIQGAVASPALDKVGFAGEGMVDELVFLKDIEQETAVDFTFAWSTDRISAVQYAIGADATDYVPLEGNKIAGLDENAIIKILITPADWYAVKEGADLEYTASEKSANLDDLVAAVTTKVDPDTGDVVVNPGESVPVADIQAAAGITKGAFFAEGTTKADLEKVLTWKNNNNTSGKADINEITFSGVEPTSPEAEAYLLNCDPEKLDEAKAAFKFPEFTPGQLPVADENNFNGRVILKGATALGAWFDVVNDTAAENYGKILVEGAPVVPSFFKAVLVK